MTDIALYPGARGSGKTTLLLEQVNQATTVGQTVAILVPNGSCRRDLYHAMQDWDDERASAIVFVEDNVQSSRGFRFDQIFIDDADCFRENPMEIAEHFHPGVPLTVMYTPSPKHGLDVKTKV